MMLLVLVVLVDEDDDDAADNASALIWSLHHGECVIVVGCRSYCTLALLGTTDPPVTGTQYVLSGHLDDH